MDVHQKTVIRAGWVAIGVNLVLFGLKIVVSSLTGSLAILTDALHGLVDTLSGIVVVASERIKPRVKTDEKAARRRALTHQDIERIGTRIIAVIILLVAVHLIVEAIHELMEPSETRFSLITLGILAVAGVTKIVLGLYLGREGRRVNSTTLKASSVETLNDSIISGAVLISALCYLWWQIDIEAPVSIIVAVFILKSGVELLLPAKKHKK